MFVLVCAASAYALLIGNLYQNETVQKDQYDYRETLTDEFISVEKLRTGELAVGMFAVQFVSQAAMANGTPQLASTSAVAVSVRTFGNPTQRRI